MFRARKMLAVGLGAGLIGLASLIPATPALAAPVSAQAQICTIKLVSLTANDLQEEGQGRDEIFIKFNDTRFRTDGQAVYFYDNTVRYPASFGHPSEDYNQTVTIKVIEDDPFANEKIGDVESLGCVARNDYPIQFSGGGALYTMVVDVTKTII